MGHPNFGERLRTNTYQEEVHNGETHLSNLDHGPAGL